MTHPAGTKGAVRVVEAHGMEGIKCCAESEQEKNLGMAGAHLVPVNESSEERRMSRGVGIERAE